MAVKPYDYEKQKRLTAQADDVATLLGVDPETVMVDGNYGVSLTPDQLDKLLTEVFANGHSKGYELAVKRLKDTAEASNVEGPERNLTQWAVMISAASFLESQSS